MGAMPSSRYPRPGAVRSPVVVWVLTLVTVGVFGVVHHYLINRELRDFGVEVRPVAATLAVFPGALLLIPPFISVWRTAERIAVAQETVGRSRTARGGIAAVSLVALFAVVAYHQSELNRVWAVEIPTSPTPAR